MPSVGTNAYKGRGGIVYKAMRELRAKHLDLFDEQGRAFNTGWFSKVKMENDNDTVYYTYDADLMPYLFYLKKELGYTITTADVILAMESPMGIRLYLYLRSIYSLKGERRITLDEIRERTGNAGRYELYADLRRYILTPALDDINKYSDMEVEYKVVREGRKVVALDFNITMKKGEVLANSEYNRIHKLGY
jgi:plasmid replication initiation protein